jgi:hypothetical protein
MLNRRGHLFIEHLSILYLYLSILHRTYFVRVSFHVNPAPYFKFQGLAFYLSWGGGEL